MKAGHPTNFYPRQESAGNTEWKVLAEGLIFLPLLFSRLTSVLPPLQPLRPIASRWVPWVIADELSASKGAPNFHTSVGVSGLSA